MKKMLAVGIFAVLALVCASSAFAVPVNFVDVVSVNQWLGTASFSHSIIDNGFVPATDTLTDATLDLDITGGPLATVRLSLENANQGNYWIWDPTLDAYDINVAWLQTDGNLNVTVRKNSGLVYLCSSTLEASGDRAAVPEPATMVLLGTGLVGLLGLKRKK